MLTPDKVKHLKAGFVISLIAGLVVYPLMKLLPFALIRALAEILSGPSSGLIAAALAGAFKEAVVDWVLKRGQPEWLDFWATVLGGVLGAAVLILFGSRWS